MQVEVRRALLKGRLWDIFSAPTSMQVSSTKPNDKVTIKFRNMAWSLDILASEEAGIRRLSTCNGHAALFADMATFASTSVTYHMCRGQQ